MNYQFQIDNPNQQYIHITIETIAVTDNPIIQLPSWRPGRYELANFAKNVKGFKVFNSSGKRVNFHKTTKDAWQLAIKKGESFKILYGYYSNLLNAGSTYLDATQLYVNPVNCCMYQVGQENEKCSLNLSIPEQWEVATSLKKEGTVFTAVNFDELADSPFICSANLQHSEYVSGATKFHVWFNGIVKPDWDRVIKDFKAFSDKQIEKFSEFPVDEYHFLIHILPYKAYHGVEHCKSTVISLGPSYDVFGSLYKELLGVSSHELYHSWNVKTIRPIEMFPYDFTKENYSRMGYLCEGVTTYMGDLFLLKSKVFTLEQYLVELTARFQIHFDNYARFNYSVAESSFDTWLDGYEPGAPYRKVSIYTEGSLLAFVADVMILNHTGNKYGLDEVMRRLYFNYYLQGKGVSEADYKHELEAVGNCSFDDYFEKYVGGNEPYEAILTEALDYLGLELLQIPAQSYSQAKLGMKYVVEAEKTIAKQFYPGAPADLGKIMIDDQIIAVNGIVITGNLDQWLAYFDEDEKRITINRAGRLIEVVLPEVSRNFYMERRLKPVENPNNFQKKAIAMWSE